MIAKKEQPALAPEMLLKKTKTFALIKTATAIAGVLLGAILLIADAGQMVNAAARSVDICLHMIIPSLFAFMAISTFLINSGLYAVVLKPFLWILRFVIKLDEECTGIFLLSIVGGYPTGAKLLKDKALRDRSPAMAEQMLPFCYCGGPVFLITVFGIQAFGDTDLGLAVYLSNVAAVLLLAVILSRRIAKKSGATLKKEQNPAKPPAKININLPVIIGAVTSAGRALFPVCAMIVAFSAVTEGFRFLGADNSVLFAFLEISNAANMPKSLPLAALLSSFGGLCIILQVAALTATDKADMKIRLRGFILARIPAAVISALICFAYMQIAHPVIADSASVGVRLLPPGNPLAALALFIMAGMLTIADTVKEK
jgi:hypothetical protein